MDGQPSHAAPELLAPEFVIKGTGLKRREFLKFGLAAGTAVSAGSLLNHPLVSQALAQKKKREITIAIGVEIPTLWPYKISQTGPAGTVLDSIFDKLTYFGSCKGGAPKLQPGLAESWEFKGKEWIIKLRKGVKFHNGEDLTAAVVAEALTDARAPRMRTRTPLVLVDGSEAIDEYTVRVTTKRPLAQQAWGLSTIPIGSSAAKKKYGKEIKRHAIGTGLFRQVEWILGERLVVERVPNWWGFKAGGDLPFNPKNNIERITWRTIKQPIAMLTALETGEIDVAQYVLPHEVDRLSKKKSVRIAKVEHTRTGLIIMNQRFKPFDDVRVRKAINYGVDWPLINRQLLQGKVSDSPGPVLPGQVGYDGTLKSYPYDPAKAKALLAEAGYGNGLDIELTVTPSGVELKRIEMGEAMSQQLKQVGITCKVKSVEFGFFLRNYFRNKLPCYLFSFTTYPDPWLYFLQFLYSKGTNRTAYHNARVDALFEQASNTLDDDKRGEFYKQALAIVREDAVLVWRSTLTDYRGTRSNIDYAPRCLDNFLRPQILSVKA